MQSALPPRPARYQFPHLTAFTSEEVRLWNWFCHIGPSPGEWSSWLAEVLGHIVERPNGVQLKLVQTHTMEDQAGVKPLSFGSKINVVLGRDPGSDVVLSANAVSKKHARLSIVGSQAYLEDLGGKLGTYLWDMRVPAHEPKALRDGDEFSIFPYRFRVNLETCWAPEEKVKLGQCGVQVLTRGQFIAMAPPISSPIVLLPFPSREAVLLSLDPLFAAELRRRILAPLHFPRADFTLPSDDSLLTFVTLSVLERFNRQLKFPVHFTLAPSDTHSANSSTRGILASSVVNIGGLSSHFRVFLPFQLLTDCLPEADSETASLPPPATSWKFPISCGFIELLPAVLAEIETGDILIPESQRALLFPNDFSKAWLLSEDPGNELTLTIDKYSERSVHVDAAQEASDTGPAPDLAALPVRLHVIVGEEEFTMAELRSLSPGVIVELQAGTIDPVRLMLNGRILGEGELVEVDGRLAVRVLSWRTH